MPKKIFALLFLAASLSNLTALADDVLNLTEQRIIDHPEQIYDLAIADHTSKGNALSTTQAMLLKKSCMEYTKGINSLKENTAYFKNANDLLALATAEYPDLVALCSQAEIDNQEKNYNSFVFAAKLVATEQGSFVRMTEESFRGHNPSTLDIQVINVINYLSTQYNREYIKLLTALGKRKECARFNIFGHPDAYKQCIDLITNQLQAI